MVWDGVERRKNGINGRQIIGEMKSRVDILETRFDDRWTMHDKMAEDRQRVTCTKLGEIKADIEVIKINANVLDKTTTTLMASIDTKLANLPCKERQSWYSSMKGQLIVLWAFISAIALTIIASWVNKW